MLLQLSVTNGRYVVEFELLKLHSLLVSSRDLLVHVVLNAAGFPWTSDLCGRPALRGIEDRPGDRYPAAWPGNGGGERERPERGQHRFASFGGVFVVRTLAGWWDARNAAPKNGGG